MPNKLTDTEIKKALECCSTYHDVRSCKNCPLDGKCEPNLLEQNALDLINRQEGENEKNENIIRVADKTIATLNAENESLKAEVERLNLEIEATNELMNLPLPFKSHFDMAIEQAKTEAYKECIEKVKEKLGKLPQWICRRAEFQNIGFSYDEVFFSIEKTKNELVGDGDA